MTLDEAIDALQDVEAAAGGMRWLLANWTLSGPHLQALLGGFVSGHDESERTSAALYYAVHMLAERQESASFGMFCRLLHDPDRAGLVVGTEEAVEAMPSLLVSLFDGRTELLLGLIADPAVADTTRCDALLALAYLVRTQAVPERTAYEAIAAMPEHLEPRGPAELWYGWLSAVMMLGFAGLAALAKQVLRQGWVPEGSITLADFWDALNGARAEPRDMTGPLWDRVGPFGSAVAYLTGERDYAEPMPAPPLRKSSSGVGRNDPCPCGSGKKYKKCCLGA